MVTTSSVHFEMEIDLLLILVTYFNNQSFHRKPQVPFNVKNVQTSLLQKHTENVVQTLFLSYNIFNAVQQYFVPQLSCHILYFFT